MAVQKRILIVRPDRIGDVVLSTPLPREIKKTFPNSFVAVLLRKYTADIYMNNPHVDKILLIDDERENSFKTFFRKIKEIRKYKFTHSLSLLPNQKLNYLFFIAGIPYRVGVGHKFYQFITFTKYVSRNKYIPLRHEADYCLDLARKIGVKSNNLTTEIFLSDEEKKEVIIKRNELLGNKKYLIGIHATCGNSSPNWELTRYKQLADLLCRMDNFQVLITDNKHHKIFENPKIIFPNLDSSLRESIKTIACLDLLISSSTGPMHISAALKVKTISLFCPMTACSPKLWGPMGNDNKLILPDESYCSNKCPGDPKICTFEGDGGIDVSSVYNIVLDELKKSM
jgi:heptosyltransferase-2